MTKVSPTLSMGTLLGILNAQATDLDDFLFTLSDKDIDAEDVATIKELRDTLKAKFAWIDSKWEAYAKADVDPFASQDEHDKCRGDYDKAKITLDQHLKAAKTALDRARDEGTT